MLLSCCAGGGTKTEIPHSSLEPPARPAVPPTNATNHQKAGFVLALGNTLDGAIEQIGQMKEIICTLAVCVEDTNEKEGR